MDNSEVRELANMEALIISAMLNDGEYPVENVGKHATQIAKILTFNGYALTRIEPQICPECGGTGNKQGLYDRYHEEAECPTCNGTGKVSQIDGLELTPDEKCDFADMVNDIHPKLNIKVQSTILTLIDEVAQAQLKKATRS